MKNNKAFTLIELIVIITLIGVILLFALPNVTSTLDRNKKDVMINDAKDFIEKTKNYLLLHSDEYPNKDVTTTFLFLKEVDLRNEIDTSPYGKKYDRECSCVAVKYNENSGIVNYSYSVYLIDGNNKVDASLSELNSDNKYKKIAESNVCNVNKCKEM
ncbi:MAG: type II secretion system protein [bacterium]|nr:type II secretion system protein [bacterium]